MDKNLVFRLNTMRNHKRSFNGLSSRRNAYINFSYLLTRKTYQEINCIDESGLEALEVIPAFDDDSELLQT